MNSNVITVKTALSTGVLLGGMMLSTPTMGAEIDYYTSSWEGVSHESKQDIGIAQPSISFDCNAETKISMVSRDESEILNRFADSMLNGMKSMDADISEWVDEHFWDLV